MAITPDDFGTRLATLRAEAAGQGDRVRRLCDASFDAFFRNDHGAAREAIGLDDEIDAFDVRLERDAVELLGQAARDATPLESEPLRGMLTLVKVNNELERIGDCGVTIAEHTLGMEVAQDAFPPTARVMTNSVLGILRDVARAYGERDAKLARLVLQSEDVVEEFKAQITRQAEQDVAAGRLGVELAFDLHELANQCTMMADHATNIAEQIIYDATGTIVRHRRGRWVLDDLERD